MKVLTVAGARPNFVKIAPLIAEMGNFREIGHTLVHTGQHYSFEMSKLFFQDLDIPEPDLNLEVGSGSHSFQTGEVLKRLDKVLQERRPDLVIVVGDCNSTLGGALAAAKLGIPVAHVEAGLRSFNWDMPEEINRVLTDRLSRLLFTTEESANRNLEKEGIPKERTHFVGNIMIDSLVRNMGRIDSSGKMKELGLEKGSFMLMTLHRPSNVDSKETFRGILDSMGRIQEEIPVVWPIHPRARKMLDRFGIDLSGQKNLTLTDPMGYRDFLSLTKNARFLMTDSGGIQEETTYLGVPCLTLRRETERPSTVDVGTNQVIGTDPKRILEEGIRLVHGKGKPGRIPELWDGKASERIVRAIESELSER